MIIIINAIINYYITENNLAFSAHINFIGARD